MDPQPLKMVPKQGPLDSVISRFEVHEAQVKRSLEAFVLVNDLLQRKGLMDGAVLWSVACLSGRPQFVHLCVLHQAVDKDIGVQTAERLANRYWSVIGCVCGVALLEDRGNQTDLPRLGNTPSGEGCIEQELQARNKLMCWRRVLVCGCQFSVAQQFSGVPEKSA